MQFGACHREEWNERKDDHKERDSSEVEVTCPKIIEPDAAWHEEKADNYGATKRVPKRERRCHEAANASRDIKQESEHTGKEQPAHEQPNESIADID